MDNNEYLKEAGGIGKLFSLFPPIGIILYFYNRHYVKNPNVYLIYAGIGVIYCFASVLGKWCFQYL